jgi:tyrosine-protein kinase Etk/Wzc
MGGDARVSKASEKVASRNPAPVTHQPVEEPPFSRNLVTLSAPLSPGAEAVRALRTHVLGQHVQAGRRAIAMCGPSVGVGCTFVAANLAVAIAQVGIKTLLIDGDLRAPGINGLIKPTLSDAAGLGRCLAEPGSRVGEFIDDDVLPNLSIMYAGPPAENAQELLAREWFERVMSHCMRDYDFTIIDTPPANTYSDSRRIGNVAGYALVVARRNTSLVADVKTLVEQLIDDDVQVIGTIMNAD